MEQLTVQVSLRPAQAEDLKQDAKNLRIGQPLWIKSKHTGKFDNKPVIISEDTDPFELGRWLKEEMLFVPASDLDLNPEANV
jgi:hypothetical protein